MCFCCVLVVVCCLALIVVRCSLFVGCCLFVFFAASSVSFVVYCLPFVVCS